MSDYNLKNTNNNKICWVREGSKKNYNIKYMKKQKTKKKTLKTRNVQYFK